MGADLAWVDLLALIAVLAAAGLVTGLLAGLLGIGGGGVLVPILYEVFGTVGVDDNVRMHLSVGTALAVIIPTSIRSFRAHYARGAVDMSVLRGMAVAVAIGVLAGIVIASIVDGSVLKIVYVASALAMAVKLALGGDRWRLGAELPGNPVRAVVGGAIGLVSTLIGIGGGVYVTAFMTLYGRPIHQAVATAAGFGPIIAIPAALGYVWAGWSVAGLPAGSLGYVSVLGALLIMPTSILAAPLGVRIAHGISRRALELAFAAFLATVAVRFFLSLVL